MSYDRPQSSRQFGEITVRDAAERLSTSIDDVYDLLEAGSLEGRFDDADAQTYVTRESVDAEARVRAYLDGVELV